MRQDPLRHPETAQRKGGVQTEPMLVRPPCAGLESGGVSPGTVIMTTLRRPICFSAAMLALATLSGDVADAQRNDDKKPSLSLKASPNAGFAPLRVRVTVDVRGGADDFQDFYCPAVEWEWGDDQKSQRSEDCEPYQAGTSKIERRYSAEHRYSDSGTFNMRFRLKQGSRVVANSAVMVHVREGARDGVDN